MGRITLELLRKRSEHNEYMVSSLEEVALHQQSLEKIELLGQVCPNLKILYLQSNLISKIQNVHKLKSLQYLNLALNNVTKIQNLQKCESLEKLDLTMNFVDKAGLLTAASLVLNEHLKEVYLMGNPCADWPGYRQFLIAKLPQLQKLDGQAIKHSERIAALQDLAQLEQQLRDEVRAAGVDPDQAALAEDDSMFDEAGEVIETGQLDEKGEMRRPWCAATRILEHRETERLNQEAEERKKASSSSALDGEPAKQPRRDDFPEVKEGERFWQKNEGQWDFSLEEDEGGRELVLDVDVGKYLDTSLIKVDVQPTYIRLLIKGRLLQLQLPCEVRPDASAAQRSGASGKLRITMPKENAHEAVHDVAHIRPAVNTIGGGVSSSNSSLKPGAKPSIPLVAGKPATGKGSSLGGSKGDLLQGREVRKATVHAVDADDDDFVPDL